MAKDFNAVLSSVVSGESVCSAYSAESVVNPINMGSLGIYKGEVKPIWSILTRFRTAKKAALWQGTMSDKELLDRILIEKGFPSVDFRHGFSRQARRLLDSRCFVEDCKGKGYDVFQMAQQVVLGGKGKLNETLEYGLEATFGNGIASMKGKTLFTKSELGFEEPKILPSRSSLNPALDLLQTSLSVTPIEP